MPGMGLSGFHLMLSLPFAGVPGLSQKGFPGFSGWLTTVFEPSGWAEPLGERFFWIANLLLWIGWINLYAGLFNCLPAVPLDGGHIFRDLVQWPVLQDIVHALTGLPAEQEVLEKISLRASDLTRIFNLREGLTPQDDRLPKGLYRELEKTGHRITEEEMEFMLRDYYRLRGWDEMGRP